MAAVTVWTDKGLSAVATTRSHTWYADEPLEDGGTDSAPTPTEMMLGALGSCIVITIHLYANRKRWPLEKVEVHLEIERFNAGDYPAYRGDAQFIHEIREKVVLHGSQLDDDQRARLLEIGKKCPVRRVLANPTFFVEFDAKPVP
jgi:putative redox protein